MQQQQLTTEQKADIFYARILAVIDFANEVNRDLWRKRYQASATPRQSNEPPTDHVRSVPAR